MFQSLLNWHYPLLLLLLVARLKLLLNQFVWRCLPITQGLLGPFSGSPRINGPEDINAELTPPSTLRLRCATSWARFQRLSRNETLASSPRHEHHLLSARAPRVARAQLQHHAAVAVSARRGPGLLTTAHARAQLAADERGAARPGGSSREHCRVWCCPGAGSPA